MPARLNPHHSELTRQKIQAGVLIDRLHKHAMGKVKMSMTQIAAATALLDRSVAKLSQIQHTGNDGGPLKVEIVRYSTPE